MQEEKQKLELERLLWESQQKMATQLITPNKQIKLNIGGEVFFTSIETLRKYPNCTLCLIFTSHYFCSLPPEQQEKGYFIDRDAKHFRLILNFLRTGAMVWPESAGDRKELMLECEFYNLLEYVSLLPRKEFCRSASKLFGRYVLIHTTCTPPCALMSLLVFSLCAHAHVLMCRVCVRHSPLECDQDYRKITFHFDSSFLFLLSSTCFACSRAVVIACRTMLMSRGFGVHSLVHALLPRRGADPSRPVAQPLRRGLQTHRAPLLSLPRCRCVAARRPC
jgi:hypothetical protein